MLDKSISQINFKDDEEEGILPRYVYRYTLYWEHLYFNSGKWLIGRSGMYCNKKIVLSRPMTFGDCKEIIACRGDWYCCKATQCSGRFVKMRNNEDIVPLYKKRIEDNCVVVMYIFHKQ